MGRIWEDPYRTRRDHPVNPWIDRPRRNGIGLPPGDRTHARLVGLAFAGVVLLDVFLALRFH